MYTSCLVHNLSFCDGVHIGKVGLILHAIFKHQIISDTIEPVVC